MTKNRLADRFISAPFSVIDARKGEWKERKRKWLHDLGNTSESREGTLYDALQFRLPALYMSSREERERLGVSFREFVEQYADKDLVEKEMSKMEYNGVSCFDPALAEVLIHWFAPQSPSRIFDCFAGDITKGYVACKMGHTFTGIEIRKEQVELNNSKSDVLKVSPVYIADDGKNAVERLGYATQDMLISCPPYFNLEKYSENDLSAIDNYDEFFSNMREVLTASIQCLKQNRFAVIIVSDVRMPNGAYAGLPEDIIRIFVDNGCHLWNDIIYINNDTHAMLRAGIYMNNRKVVRIHQRVLVFYKGKPQNMRKHFGKITPINNNI